MKKIKEIVGCGDLLTGQGAAPGGGRRRGGRQRTAGRLFVVLVQPDGQVGIGPRRRFDAAHLARRQARLTRRLQEENLARRRIDARRAARRLGRRRPPASDT